MVGRPTKYDSSVCEKAKEYIESCIDREEQVVSGQSEKFTTYAQKLYVNFPTIEGLALHLGIHRDTVLEWEEKHEEFSGMVALLKAKQVKELLNKGLSGDYNSSIARLVLSKHGYHDKQETIHTVQKGQSFKIDGQTIEF